MESSGGSPPPCRNILTPNSKNMNGSLIACVGTQSTARVSRQINTVRDMQAQFGHHTHGCMVSFPP